ncbi:porin [Yoonia vestfoldensis]|uniref:porin n=1 Tax=Yoonia vestfoldensis TaxID=245188 RepID=UPI000362608E|nr:porin [Yoonia vestfoldensis]
MKNILLATTALVMTAGYAAADVAVTGEANVGLKYNSGDASNGLAGNTEEAQLYYELDFNVVGSITLDSGLTAGASLDLDLDVNNQSDFIDDPELFIAAGGLRLAIGNVDGADGVVVGGISDIGFDGIGIDDTAESFFDSSTANLLVTYTTGPLTFAASGNVADSEATPDEDYSFGASYDGGAFTVGAAITELGGAEIYLVGADVTVAGANVSLFYHVNDTADIAGYGASGSYPLGDIVISASIGATDLVNDEVDFGVGASYDLGGGLSLAGGIGQVDNAFLDDDSYTVADFGVVLKF